MYKLNKSENLVEIRSSFYNHDFNKVTGEFKYIKSKHMSLELFKKVLAKFDLNILTQIAIGICDVDSHPDYL